MPTRESRDEDARREARISKRAMPRITEPDEGLVHYSGIAQMDAVTLCGLTDFIYANEAGKETRKPVTCLGCKAILRYVYSYRKESF